MKERWKNSSRTNLNDDVCYYLYYYFFDDALEAVLADDSRDSRDSQLLLVMM